MNSWLLCIYLSSSGLQNWRINVFVRIIDFWLFFLNKWVKCYLSRNLQVLELDHAQCGNYGILHSLFLHKNFVKVTFLLKKILELIWRNFFWVTIFFFVFLHCHSVEKREILPHRINLTEKKIRQINYKAISRVKTLLSQNFC